MRTRLIAMKSRFTLSLFLLFMLNSVSFAAESAGSNVFALPPILENQEMLILNVDLAPGQASTPHRHNAHVYVYVLEGTIEMQVRGGPLVRLGPGEMFHESPEDIHQVSRNASDTDSAKFLVHILKTVGQPVSVPVE